MKFSHPSAYSFGHGKKCVLDKIDPLFTPGPGTYAPSINVRSMPKWKIGTEQRGKVHKSEVPGPGQYTMPYSFPNGPKYTIASKSGMIDQTKLSCSPGPGAYQPHESSGVPKYTMRIKHYRSKSDVTPGPGNYNLRSDSSLIVPSYKFGTEKKDGLNLTQTKYVPGPGNYEYKADILNKTMPKFSFGKELRSTSKRSNTPGPGTYNYKEYIGKEAPRITMSMKLFRTSSDSKFVPGPGQYNQTNSNFYKIKPPSYKIGTAKRDSIYRFRDSPGPGQYKAETSAINVRSKTPSWVIGTGKRPPLNPIDKYVPSVGNYNISQSLGNGPKYTMVGRRTYVGFRNRYPGPGAYNGGSMNNLKKSPSWKIGTGSRDDAIEKVIRENIPGPGMYNSNNNERGPQYRFGTEKRGENTKSDVPGPGQYHIPCSIVDVNDYTRQSGKFDPGYKYI